MGRLYYLKGQPQQARSLFSQALPILEEVDAHWELMYCKIFMDELELKEAADRAGLLLAQELLLESLETARKLGRSYGHNIHIPILLGKIAYRLGEYSRAIGWHQEALAILQEFYLEEEWLDIGRCLFGLAEAEACLENAARSARLLGALDGLRSTKPFLWENLTPADFERAAQADRAALGEQAFDRWYASGQALTLGQAVAYALEEPE